MENREKIYHAETPAGLTIYLKMPDRKPIITGYIFGKTYRTVKKTAKNIMRLYQNGIGINCQIFDRYNFDFIELDYNGEIKKTTRIHFLKHCIPSKFTNNVDAQFILPLAKWYIPLEIPKPIVKEEPEELTLFSQAV